MEKILVYLGFADLIVSVDTSGAYPEVYLSLRRNDGTDNPLIQDICMVSQAVVPFTRKEIPNAVRCLVWHNPADEDDTTEFVIDACEGIQGAEAEPESMTSKLYKKMFAEHEKYLQELSSIPVRTALEDHSDEYTLRRDILVWFEEYDLEDHQAAALLKLETPMAAILEFLQERKDSDNSWEDAVEAAIHSTLQDI